MTITGKTQRREAWNANILGWIEMQKGWTLFDEESTPLPPWKSRAFLILV
jgi:hypothetical protein